jgi:hypothetical protein
LAIADTMPAGMPMASAMTIAMSASSIVTGSFSAISAVTGFLHAQRFAEVAVHHAAEPVRVADGKRLVEVHLLAKIFHDGRILVLAGEHLRRVAGKQLLQPEDQDRDEQQRRQDRRKPAGEEREHCACDGVIAA